MRCDDIFERSVSGKINNSRCRKQTTLLKATSSSHGTKLQAQATPKPLQADPQIAQPPPLHLLSLKPSNRRRSRGARMALGLCRESWKKEGDFSGYLCTRAISGGDSSMDVRFQNWNFFSINRSFVTFSRSICGSVAPMSSL